MGYPVAKDLSASAGGTETRVRCLGLEDPLRRKWQPTPVIYLGNPMDTGAWQVIVPEVTKSQTQLSSHTNKTSLSVQFSRSVVSDSL